VQQGLCQAVVERRLALGASTTLVAAHIDRKQVAVVNSGDSRAYLLQRDGTVKQLSHDHTEKRKLLDEGAAPAGVFRGTVYDALSDCLVADSEAGNFVVHRAAATVDDGDSIILCSNGTYGALDETAWLARMARLESPAEMVAQTRAEVLKQGAPNNFSVIVVKVSL
jgi:serine/threonine protein phosphatase PrpC